MPTIKYVHGDAIQALKNKEVEGLMHCCNDQGVMGSGIALEIKKVFPDAYTEYKRQHTVLGSLLGKCVFKSNVFNLVAQKYYGTNKRHLHYGQLVNSFVDAKYYMLLHNINTVAIPYKLGCDRAGGDWKVVYELLSIFPDYITIFIYCLDRKDYVKIKGLKE